MAAIDGKTPYDYEMEVTVTSDRGDINLNDLAKGGAVFSLDVYEQIYRPYLTGEMIIVDNVGLFEQIQFRGTEKINVSITYPRSSGSVVGANFTPFERTFVITKVEQRQKSLNDNASVIVVLLVEDIFFESKINKFSKSFQGKPSEIIDKVLEDKLKSRTVLKSATEDQVAIRFISPFWTPLAVANYMAEISTTEDGLPFFLYSTFANDEQIVFQSLEGMLQSQPVGGGSFTYSQLTSQQLAADVDTSLIGRAQDPRAIEGGQARNELQGSREELERQNMIKRGRIIEAFQHNENYDILKQVETGNVSTLYHAQNINEMKERANKYDVSQALQIIDQFLPAAQKAKTYDSISFNSLHTKDLNFESDMYLSNLYTDGSSNPDDEELQDNPIRRKLAKVLKEHMAMDNVMIRVPGFNFFRTNASGNNGTAAGRSIDLRFLKDDVDAMESGNAEEFEDQKMTGRYLIHSAKHSFGIDKYTVTATCFKYSENGADNLANASSLDAAPVTDADRATAGAGAGGGGGGVVGGSRNDGGPSPNSTVETISIPGEGVNVRVVTNNDTGDRTVISTATQAAADASNNDTGPF